MNSIREYALSDKELETLREALRLGLTNAGRYSVVVSKETGETFHTSLAWDLLNEKLI